MKPVVLLLLGILSVYLSAIPAFGMEMHENAGMSAVMFASSSKCESQGGSCYNTNNYQCSSGFISGLCPGANNIRCCKGKATSKSSSSSSSRSSTTISRASRSSSSRSTTTTSRSTSTTNKCHAQKGLCLDSNVYNCNSGYKSGLCAGGNNIRCCIGSASKKGSSSSSRSSSSSSSSTALNKNKCHAQKGLCLDSNVYNCNNGYKSGLCAGANNIRCCIGSATKKGSTSGSSSSPTPAAVNKNKCHAQKGLCLDSNVYNCNNGYKSGLCGGGNNIRCCIGPASKKGSSPAPSPSPTPAPTPAPVNKSKCHAQKGLCLDSNVYNCNNGYKTGLCGGGNNIRCCIGPASKKGSTPAPRPSPTPAPTPSPTPAPTPAPVDKTKCHAQKGLCLDSNIYNCNNGYKTGLCGGGNNIRCCIGPASKKDSSPSPRPPPAPGPSNNDVVPSGSTYKGVDFIDLATQEQLNCIAKDYQFVVLRGFRSNGKYDSHYVTNYRRSVQAGFKFIDLYMFVCPKCSATPQQQIAGMIGHAKANGVNYNRIWIDIEQKKYWKDFTFNKDFVVKMVAEGRRLGAKIGIYSNKNQYIEIFGNANWDALSAYPVWYARYNNRYPNMSDWGTQKFGGFAKPYIKQWAENRKVCGLNTDLNVM